MEQHHGHKNHLSEGDYRSVIDKIREIASHESFDRTNYDHYVPTVKDEVRAILKARHSGKDPLSEDDYQSIFNKVWTTLSNSKEPPQASTYQTISYEIKKEIEPRYSKLKDDAYLFHSADLKALDGTKFPGNNADNRAAVFDGAVRDAAQLLQVQNVCKYACQQSDLKCRSLLLQSALEAALLGKVVPQVLSDAEYRELPGILRDFSSPRGFSAFSSTMKRNWPAHEFAFPSSTLADRDPFIDSNQSPGIKMFGTLGFKRVIDRDHWGL